MDMRDGLKPEGSAGEEPDVHDSNERVHRPGNGAAVTQRVTAISFVYSYLNRILFYSKKPVSAHATH
jgi:hypothetical protein